RIVVMKDGFAQQVDSPQNLYNKPQNLFVAGFIGSPQMNLIDSTVVKEGNDVKLKFAEYSIKLTEAQGKKLIDGGYVDKTVILGIRPEDVHDQEIYIESSPDSVFDATVKVYELLGAEVYLYFDIAGASCTARVNPRTTARPGDIIKFSMDLTKLHVFDKDTQQIVFN
ncbi:MAG: ABC transporter ATP-binding protein, partial [Clostridiales bacterium]|nr:ABC transporter ATP-binding protein [Clostridiales bacterium]